MYEFNEGDLVEHGRKKEYGYGIVLRGIIYRLQVQWNKGVGSHLPESLHLITKGNGKEIKLQEDFTREGHPIRKRLDTLYGKNRERKQLSHNEADLIKEVVIILSSLIALCILILCVYNYHNNSLSIDKDRYKALESCVEKTSKPLSCREALR